MAPAGLAHGAGRPSPFQGPIKAIFRQHDVLVNPNLCLFKPTTRDTSIIQKATVKVKNTYTSTRLIRELEDSEGSIPRRRSLHHDDRRNA
jgi:hypothetical protein